MLEIICSRDAEYLQKLAIDCAVRADAEHPLVVLVPSQISFMTERKIAMAAGGLFHVRVMSFERMTGEVLTLCGGRARTQISAAGLGLLVRSALSGAELEIIDPVSDAEAHIKLAELITALKAEAITPDMIAAAAETQSAATAKKLRDCAAVWRRVEEMIAGTAILPAEAEELAARNMEEYIKKKPSRFIAFGFDALPGRRLLYIDAIARQTDMALYMQCEKDDEIYGARYAAMESFARRCGGKISALNKTAERPAEIAHLFNKLYSYPTCQYADAAERITLERAADREQEAQWACDAIMRLCDEQDINMRDIAVLTGDTASWEGVLRDAFEKNGIPAYIASKRSALDSRTAEFLLSAMDVALYGRLFDFKRHIKTGFLPVDGAQTDELLRYVREHGVHGSQLLRPLSRSGSEAAEQIRALAFGGLQKFVQRVKKAGAGEITGALTEYMQWAGIEEKLEAEALRLRAAGAADLAGYTDQLYQKITALLEQAARLLPEDIGLSGMRDAVSGGLSATSVATVPQMADELTVGDVSHSIQLGMSAVFVLGVNEGLVPPPPGEGRLFGGREAERLCEQCAGFPAPPSYEEQRASMLRSFASAQYLYFSSNAADGLPSVLMTRLERLFPMARRIENHAPATAGGGLTSLALALSGGKSGDPIVGAYMDGDRRRLGRVAESVRRAGGSPKLDAARAKELYGELSGTASRIEGFYRCPYRHFVEYGLRPRRELEYEEGHMDAGVYIHGLMEDFAKRVCRENISWETLSDEDIDRYMSESASERTKEHNRGIFSESRRFAAEERYLRQDAVFAARALRSHMSGTGTKIAALELDFGRGGDIEIGPPGERIRLRGRIDRVDIAAAEGGEFLRVVDYKSGNRKFDLSSVYYGLSLQLMIYLIAAMRRFGGETVRPAGGFYFSLKAPLIDEAKGERQIKMSGFLLACPQAAEALDPAGERLLSMSAEKNRFSEEDMRSMISFAEEMIARAAKDILDGNIALSPLCEGGNLECENCEYGALCMADEKNVAPTVKTPVDRETFFRKARHETD